MPYAGGQYHGKLIFPSDYPYKPPAIMMLTPNGRFNTNTRLCLSMSDFHPESCVSPRSPVLHHMHRVREPRARACLAACIPYINQMRPV